MTFVGCQHNRLSGFRITRTKEPEQEGWSFPVHAYLKFDLFHFHKLMCAVSGSLHASAWMNVLYGAQQTTSLGSADEHIDACLRIGCDAPQLLLLGRNNFDGMLPLTWAYSGALPSLRVLEIDENRLQGTLPELWGSVGGGMMWLERLSLTSNSLKGSLPQQWGANGTFVTLKHLHLRQNKLSGRLPESWARYGSFPALRSLSLNNNSLNGTLPSSWGERGAFPELRRLLLGNNRLNGGAPF